RHNDSGQSAQYERSTWRFQNLLPKRGNGASNFFLMLKSVLHQLINGIWNHRNHSICLNWLGSTYTNMDSTEMQKTLYSNYLIFKNASTGMNTLTLPALSIR